MSLRGRCIEIGLAQVQSGMGNLLFRNDPNSIEWDYNLVSHQDDTYGGRVVQLLGVNISGITVQGVAGSGGPEYRQQVALYFRDLLLYQRDTAAPAVFSYPTRKFSFQVYVVSFAYTRSLTEDPSRPFTIQFQVVEELSNTVTKSIMSAELKKLVEGVGWKDSTYSNVNFGVKTPAKDKTTTPADPGVPTGPTPTTPGDPLAPKPGDPGPGGYTPP